MGVFMLLNTVFGLDMRWKLRDLQRSRREESMVGTVFLWYIQNRQSHEVLSVIIHPFHSKCMYLGRYLGNLVPACSGAT